MKEWFKFGLALSMVGGVVGAFASGCGENDASLFIRQVMAPGGSECSYAADPGGAALSGGVMDLAFTREYVGGLLVGNQLVEQGSAETLRAESARFKAEGAEVEIETSDGGKLGSFTVPVTGFIDPARGSEPGWGIVQTVLVDSSTGARLAGSFEEGKRSSVSGRIVVVVKVYGKTLGGRELESGKFRFPINVCYGCLVTFPADAADGALKLPNCENRGEMGGIGEPCFLGQDEPVDCRLCQAIGGPDGICLP